MRLAMRNALFAITIGIIKLRLSQAIGWCFPGSQTLRKIGHTPSLPYFWHRVFKFDCKGGRFLAGVAVGYRMYYLGDKMAWRCTDGLTAGLYDNGTDYEDNERVYFDAGIVGVSALVDTGEIEFAGGTLDVTERLHNLRFSGTRFVWNGEAMVYEYHETDTIVPVKSPYDTDFMESRCPDNTVANGVYMLHTNYVWEIRLKCTKLSNVCKLPEPPDHRVTPAPTNFPTPQPTPYPTTLAPTEVPTAAVITPAPQRARIPPGTVRTPAPTPSPTHSAPTQSPTRPLPKDDKPFFTKKVIIVIATTLGLILVMTCIISYFCLTGFGYMDPIKIYSGDDDNAYHYQPAKAPRAFRADAPDISDDWAQD